MKPMLIQCLVFLLVFVQIGLAQIPRTMSYQGVLMDADGSPVNGTYQAKFRLYNVETGGTAEWTDEQEISVTDGLLNVILGSDINPISVSFDQQYWLGITLGDSELSPRIQLTSIAYSFNTLSVAESTITSNNIADAQVVRSINSHTDNVVLAAGENVSITESNDTLYVAAIGGGNGSVDGEVTAGQVAYWEDATTLSGDTELYWDNTNKNLGLGTSNPTEKLTLGGDILFTNSADRVISVQPEVPSSTDVTIGKSLTILGGGDLELATAKDTIGGVGASIQIGEGQSYAPGNGGDVRIKSGSSAYGGTIKLQAGEGFDAGGNVIIDGGGGQFAGDIFLQGGFGESIGGSIRLKGGDGKDKGGNVRLTSGLGSTEESMISLTSNKVSVRPHAGSNQMLFEVEGIISSAIGGFRFPDSSIQTSAANVFSLPFSATTAAPGQPAFSITQTGGSTVVAAPAAVFAIDKTEDQSPALFATTNGRGIAVHGLADGEGAAAFFENKSANNSQSVVYGLTKGTGTAGLFENRNSNNNQAALEALTTGTGDALLLKHNGASGNIANFTSNNEPRVVITKNGSVGIGTSDVPEKLTVEGNILLASGADRMIKVADSPDGDGNNLVIEAGRGDNNINFGTEGGDLILRGGNAGGNGRPGGKLILQAGNGDNEGSDVLIRAGTITGGLLGDVEISGGQVIDLNVDPSIGTVLLNGKLGVGTEDVSNIITVQQGSATDPVADSWEQYSSRRWKKNIKTLYNGLEKVQKLRGVSYDSKSNDKHEIGLIAEEVGEVIPEVVQYEENGIDAKSIDYARLVAVLIEAVKEQQQQIEELQQLVRAQNSNLTSKK